MSSDNGGDSPTPDSSSSPPPPSPSSEESSPPPPSSSPPPPSPPPSSPPPSSPPPSSPPPSPPSEDHKSPPPPSSGGSSPSPPDNGSSPSHTSPPPPPPPPSPSNNQQAFSPPQPPHRQLPSPTWKPSDSSNNIQDSNESQSSLPVLIGFASVAGLLLLVVVLLAIVCSRKKKKKSSEPPVQYYYTNQKPCEYFKHQGGEHVVNIPPPPAGGWGPTTVPPPQRVSSDLSNSSFSGPVLPPPHPTVALGFNQSTFTYEELSAATGGFAQRYLLGQGGFGYVHKGVLPNGKEIAVKSLKATGGQGDREFKAEVDTISRVHHRYLVSLVGYCISDTQKLLVYEYVPNKTLDYHLHGKGLPVMNWDARLKIALGAAKGLAYLHEDCHPRIIHRDIKGSNILLDNNFEAKVSDFGLAKFTQDTNTHVSTRVMGTFGYLAPEYASSGKLSEKSDVFSYGVMLLELITGRRPVGNGDYEEDSLVDWARPLCTKALESGNFEGLVDPRLDDNYDKQEMTRMVACGAASVRHSARRRPKMSYVVRVLEGDALLDLLNQDGVKPGQSAVYSSASGDYNAATYSADMKNYKKLAYDGVHSEFGDTSEYGLNLSASSSDLSSAEYGRRTGGSRIMNSP